MDLGEIGCAVVNSTEVSRAPISVMLVLRGLLQDSQYFLEDTMEWKWMWKKTKVVKISRQSSPVQIMIDKTNKWRMWND